MCSIFKRSDTHVFKKRHFKNFGVLSRASEFYLFVFYRSFCAKVVRVEFRKTFGSSRS